jgi:hypothetical protein
MPPPDVDVGVLDDQVTADCDHAVVALQCSYKSAVGCGLVETKKAVRLKLFPVLRGWPRSISVMLPDRV